jgi:hypothetical protein
MLVPKYPAPEPLTTTHETSNDKSDALDLYVVATALFGVIGAIDRLTAEIAKAELWRANLPKP